MDKKQLMANRPFTVKDSTEMQNWIENAIKENIKNVLTPGILTGLEVQSNDSFGVRVKAGKALDFNYEYIKVEKDINLNLDLPHSTLSRIDLVTIRYKQRVVPNVDTENKFGKGSSWIYSNNLLDDYEIRVIKGNNSTNPVMPATPSGELALASIFIGPSQGSIRSEHITDRRSIAQFLDKPIISSIMPVGSFKEGQVWHNPESMETQMFVNGTFQPIGGIPPIISEEEPEENLKEGLVWYNPYTNTIKFYLNGQFRQLDSSIAILPFTNSVILQQNATEVEHGINIYIPDRDVIFVHKNTVHLQRGVDYEISEDGKRIVSLQGTWTKDTRFDFLVIYSSPLTDALNTARFINTYTASGGEANVNINIPEYNMNNDVLDVYYTNSTGTTRYKLFEGTDFTILNNARISLTKLRLSANEKITFYVWKKIRIDANLSDGALIENESISDYKLAKDIKIGNLLDLTTTVKINVVSAINEVNNKLNSHINNSSIHVTSSEKSNWNSHINNNTIHLTSNDRNNLHSHSNKTILDRLTDQSGELRYNGQPIGNPNAVNKSGDTVTGAIIFSDTNARLVIPVGTDRWAT